MTFRIDWMLIAHLMLPALLSVALGLLVLRLFFRPRPHHIASVFDDRTEAAVFLFDGETLIDCSPEARALLAATPEAPGPWLRLANWLGQSFPGVEARFRALPRDGRFTLTTMPDVPRPLLLVAELRGGITRIELRPHSLAEHASPVAESLLAEELDGLRRLAAAMPMLVWRETEEGDVVWAGAAYLLRVIETLPKGAEPGWPLPRLFPPHTEIDSAARHVLRVEGKPEEWYDLTVVRDGPLRLVFATRIDAIVQAETARNDFLRTVTFAFSHVHIGIAVFDRQRRLQTFNPALTDLTGLPTDLLSSRPTLLAVLDAMRDRNMLPEPRDYRSWRRQLAEMEQAGANGQYEDTWSLAGGQTYRVIGRPQRDGALVLLVEDISTEVTRNHRYRHDLELGQAVIDSLDEGIAVFASSGQLVLSNAAYSTLWCHDPAESLVDAGIVQISAHWRSLSAPSPVWARIETFVGRLTEQEGWSADVRLTDGRLVTARLVPLAGGATMAAFRPAAAPQGDSLPSVAAERRLA